MENSEHNLLENSEMSDAIHTDNEVKYDVCCNCGACPENEIQRCSFCNKKIFNLIRLMNVCKQCCNKSDSGYNLGSFLKICEYCAVKYATENDKCEVLDENINSLAINNNNRTFISIVRAHLNDTGNTYARVNDIYNSLYLRYNQFFSDAAHKRRAAQRIKEIEDLIEQFYEEKFKVTWHIHNRSYFAKCNSNY